MKFLKYVLIALLLASSGAHADTSFIDRITGVSSSVAIKAPVKVETAANITLSGEQTVNSVAVVAGDRVLVKDQTDQTENGIYIVKATAWTRAEDFDGSRDVVDGTLVVVNDSVTYQVTTSDPVVIGTSNITFSVASMSATNSADSISYTQAGSGAVGSTVDVAIADIEDQAVWQATESGSGNTFTLTIDPVLTAYANGQHFYFKATHNNTGAATVNVNALGSKSIKHIDGTALVSADIVNGQMYGIIYNGTDFILIEQDFVTRQTAQTISGDKTLSGANTLSGNNTVTGQIRISGATNNNLASFGSNAEILDSGITEAGQRVLLSDSGAISSAATQDFDDVFSSSYDEYEIHLLDVIPATDATTLYLRIGNGSTYESGASNYSWSVLGFNSAGGGAVQGASGADTEIELVRAGTVGSDTNEYGISGTIKAYGPTNSTYTRFSWQLAHKTQVGSIETTIGSGERLAAASEESARFLFAAGNIESGRILVYGIKK